ncbi:hypothetical protein C0J52_28086 [Blattella germanica]|nr:hypothetical protein C0J52_28086 [Blattella germanica]
MGTIIDEEMIVAVQLKEIETEHETLEDGVRLECDDAIQIPLVLGLQYRAVYLPIQQRQEVIFAQR